MKVVSTPSGLGAPNMIRRKKKAISAAESGTVVTVSSVIDVSMVIMAYLWEIGTRANAKSPPVDDAMTSGRNGSM
jgi:hypothetical protein